MRRSDPHPGIHCQFERRSPAAGLAWLWSLGLHAVLLGWFLITGGSTPGAPAPGPSIETPIYVTLVADPAPTPEEAQTPPAPVLPEPVEADLLPADPVPTVTAPVEAPADMVEAPEPPPAVESAREPRPRLMVVHPPARPPRPAPPQPTPKPRLVAQPTARAAATSPAFDTGGAVTRKVSAGSGTAGLIERPATYPDYLSNPAPEYPRSELRRGRESVVMLTVRVSAQGRAEKIAVTGSAGIPAFDEAAVRAVRRWRFVPAMRAGNPVTGWVKVPIRFTLTRR